VYCDTSLRIFFGSFWRESSHSRPCIQISFRSFFLEAFKLFNITGPEAINFHKISNAIQLVCLLFPDTVDVKRIILHGIETFRPRTDRSFDAIMLLFS
jgi:hypothetical protein